MSKRAAINELYERIDNRTERLHMLPEWMERARAMCERLNDRDRMTIHAIKLGVIKLDD